MPKIICENEKCGNKRRANLKDAIKYLKDNEYIIYCGKCGSIMNLDPKKKDKWERKAAKLDAKKGTEKFIKNNEKKGDATIDYD